jgi:hypothetical protein
MAGAGAPQGSRSFSSKSDARVWAREKELEADHERPQVHKTDIVSRYRDEVVLRKRHHRERGQDGLEATGQTCGLP